MSRISSLDAQTQPDSQKAPGQSDKVERILERITDEKDRSEKNRELFKVGWLHFANELYALLGDQDDESGQTFKEISDTFVFLEQVFAILRPQDGEVKLKGTLEELKEIAKVARIRNKPRVIEAVKEQLDSLREF